MKRLLILLGLAGLIALPGCAQGGAAAPSSVATTPGATFRECRLCPEMVVVPPGAFTMGSSAEAAGHQDHEGPAHPVRVARAFAIGISDVTRNEYAAFIRATGRTGGDGCHAYDGKLWPKAASNTWRHPGFRQSGRDPVVCVSWEDAQAYVAWLNGKLRHGAAPSGGEGPYRLPTEAEWEYAAQAGTTTRYWWGNTLTHDNANYGADPCCGPVKQGADRWLFTSPAGSFPANPFGLYDMNGNAGQWTADCWHDTYAGAPADGSAWMSGDCKYRAVHGGSWTGYAQSLRPANRHKHPPDVRYDHLGFRLARTLE